MGRNMITDKMIDAACDAHAVRGNLTGTLQDRMRAALEAAEQEREVPACDLLASPTPHAELLAQRQPPQAVWTREVAQRFLDEWNNLEEAQYEDADEVFRVGSKVFGGVCPSVPASQELAELRDKLDRELTRAEKAEARCKELEAEREEAKKIDHAWVLKNSFEYLHEQIGSRIAKAREEGRQEGADKERARVLLNLTEQDWDGIAEATARQCGAKSWTGGNSHYWGVRNWLKEHHGVDDTWDTRQARRAAGHEREDSAYVETALAQLEPAKPQVERLNSIEGHVLYDRINELEAHVKLLDRAVRHMADMTDVESVDDILDELGTDADECEAGSEVKP